MRRLQVFAMAAMFNGCVMSGAAIIGEDEITVAGVYAYGHGVYQCTENWLRDCVQLAVAQCANYGGTKTQMQIQSTSFERMVAGTAYSRYVFTCVQPAQPVQPVPPQP